MTGETDFEKWVQRTPGIMELVERITLTNLPLMEQAKMAFYEMGQLLEVPLQTDDFSEGKENYFRAKGIKGNRSVFEEIGIIRYLEPDDDPRGIVMAAMYHIKHNRGIDMDECALQHFGSKEKVPKGYMVYYMGQDADATMHFMKAEDETWVKEGVKCAVKISKV